MTWDDLLDRMLDSFHHIFVFVRLTISTREPFNLCPKRLCCFFTSTRNCKINVRMIHLVEMLICQFDGIICSFSTRWEEKPSLTREAMKESNCLVATYLSERWASAERETGIKQESGKHQAIPMTFIHQHFVLLVEEWNDETERRENNEDTEKSEIMQEDEN